MGAGETVHKQIEAHVRALKLQMERRYSITIGISDFMTPWLIRQAAWLQNRFKKDDRGQTAYYRLTGTSYWHSVVECGEMVLARERDVRRVGKFKPSWVKGTWCGKTDNSDENVIMTPNGVMTCRNIHRVDISQRYDSVHYTKCFGVPWKSQLGRETRAALEDAESESAAAGLPAPPKKNNETPLHAPLSMSGAEEETAGGSATPLAHEPADPADIPVPGTGTSSSSGTASPMDEGREPEAVDRGRSAAAAAAVRGTSSSSTGFHDIRDFMVPNTGGSAARSSSEPSPVRRSPRRVQFTASTTGHRPNTRRRLDYPPSPSGADAVDDLALREHMPELEAESKRHRLAGLEVTTDIFIATIDDDKGDDLDELQQRLKREQKDNEDLEELWEDSELRPQNEEHMLHDNDNMTLTENGQWFPTPLLEKGIATGMSRLMAFRTIEEISREEADRLVREEGAKYVSSRWEDQTKGNEVRSRRVLRQVATKAGHESSITAPSQVSLNCKWLAVARL
jgi:hypothetical protein